MGSERIMVVTIHQGMVVMNYANSVWNLLKDPTIHFGEIKASTQDVCRVRNREVRNFLNSNHTHLLFIDADISFDPGHVKAMLKADKDIVAAPYPRRHVARWGSEEGAYDYAMANYKPRESDPETNTIEVDLLPTGFMLIKRHVLEKMAARYQEEVGYTDRVASVDYPTVGLFNLMFHNPDGKRRLLSEDFSFCKRWTDMGGKIHMYCVPVDHHGMHHFRGSVDGLFKNKPPTE